MGGRQLPKSVGTLDHIKQRNDESLTNLYDNLSVIPINTMNEIAVRLMSYIDLEIAKEGCKHQILA